MLDTIKHIRRDLHQIPELELSLPKTKEYLLKILEQLPCTIECPMESSILCFFDNHKENTIAFRSDMDALPIEENTHTSYQSRHAGCMHACGHDGHMAMLTGFAIELSSYYQQLDHNILLIYQPGEENPGGAKLLCDLQILEKYHVHHIFGCHLWPNIDKGVIQTRPNEMMARSSEINIDIIGKASHVATYDQGIDALEIASRYLLDIYQMEADVDPKEFRLLRFGKMNSGQIRNIISNRTRLEGTLRACKDETYWYLRNQVESISKKYPASFQFTYSQGYPALINDSNLVSNILHSIPSIQLLEKPELITEDFSYYLQKVPGVFFFLGTGTGIPLHANTFDFDETILLNGIQLYIQLSKLGCTITQ